MKTLYYILFFFLGFIFFLTIYFIFFFPLIFPTIPSNEDDTSKQYVVSNPCDKYDCTKGK